MSADRSKESIVGQPASLRATPIDAVTFRCSPSIWNGWLMRETSRSAIRSTLSGLPGSNSIVQANSSPPNRAASAESGKIVAISPATARSSASPTVWPCISLTVLKWSRSSIISATALRRLSARTTIAAPSSARLRRLRNPVSGSFDARNVARSSAAARSSSSRDKSRWRRQPNRIRATLRSSAMTIVWSLPPLPAM